MKIAVLDDYQNVALESADWRAVKECAAVDVFHDHAAEPDAVVARLRPYDIVCVMRERTPLDRRILEQLPLLKLVCSTGRRNASIDLAAAAELGIEVLNTSYTSAPTIEYTWALILASARHIATESASLRSGGWQVTLGDDLADRTLGIMGLGNVGSQVAKVALAFGMNVIAWSQNLTAAAASAAGARLVSKEELLRESDIVSIHMVLSARTRGLMGAAVDEPAHCRRGRGCLRHRAAAGGSSLSPTRQSPGHTAHGLCLTRIVPTVLRRHGHEHSRMAGRH